MHINKISCCFIFALSLLGACSKTSIEPETVTCIDLHTEISLRDIDFINDTLGFICGGTPGEIGTIWKTTNGGLTWSAVLEVKNRCIYDADFLDSNNGYAGGDALLLLHTTDGGQSWVNIYENENFSSWSEFIKPIRKVAYPNPRNIIAVGGDTWYKGLMCISHNWGQNWTYKDFNNQLNDIVISDISATTVCGYGILMQSTDSCSNLSTRTLNNDNFTAIDFIGTTSGLACGYNGGIYKTSDGGCTWNEVVESNSTFEQRQHFNDICFISSNRAIAAGNNGLLLLSNDAGLTWETIKMNTESNLLAIAKKNPGEIWLCGTGGFLCQLKLPNL